MKHNIKCHILAWCFKYVSLLIDKSYDNSTNGSKTSCNFFLIKIV